MGDAASYRGEGYHEGSIVATDSDIGVHGNDLFDSGNWLRREMALVLMSGV